NGITRREFSNADVWIERLVSGNHRRQFRILLESRYQYSLNLSQFCRRADHDVYLDRHFHRHAVTAPEPTALSRHLHQSVLFVSDFHHPIIRNRGRNLDLWSSRSLHLTAYHSISTARRLNRCSVSACSRNFASGRPLGNPLLHGCSRLATCLPDRRLRRSACAGWVG